MQLYRTIYLDNLFHHQQSQACIYMYNCQVCRYIFLLCYHMYGCQSHIQLRLDFEKQNIVRLEMGPVGIEQFQTQIQGIDVR